MPLVPRQFADASQISPRFKRPSKRKRGRWWLVGAHDIAFTQLTTSCVIGKEAYPAKAVSEEDITALMIRGRAFRQTLLDSERFRQFIFQGFTSRLCAIVSRMKTVALKTIDERLAVLLLKGDDISLSNITQQVLAAEIGTAREVVSRKLKRFESDGPIRSTRGRVEILDRDNLRALSGTTDPQTAGKSKTKCLLQPRQGRCPMPVIPK